MRLALALLAALVLAGCASTSPSPSPSATTTPSTSATPCPTCNDTVTPSPEAGGADITIAGNRYAPDPHAVAPGAAVSWRNDDAVSHTVTADDGSFDSGVLAPGATFAHAMPTTAGPVAYHCRIHSSMHGTIQVVAAVPATTTPTATASATPTPTASPTPSPSASPTASPSTSPSPQSVSIVNFAFQPASLTVPAGTTVTWGNAGSATHTATSDTGAFHSGNLAQGDSYAFTFSTPGTYAYHCAIHPSMKGTITVT